ncbi:hypothetical protein K3G63_01705 [Hymenobacter sp. HSC-4F20]|uniref:hypothetical protein n=1 Tax=Hymenobacter sp. HSC-4F20 TaxID=2864135 RepID=UPI001C736818|nr:hypothetical protein [Hymenobacter sp. HSC-4F20]MBX0289131.1 hypothetical protein [Hymenobacter sp. HSC-4F20]
MKKYSLPLVLSLTLAACQNRDATDAQPAAVAAGFNQEFSLQYRQQAALPATDQVELFVTVADLDYSFCPPNARCFIADFVALTLSVRDKQGQTQQVAMPLHTTGARNPAWIDTTSVRANGQRYVIYYHRWSVVENVPHPQKKDITVVLRITKP